MPASRTRPSQNRRRGTARQASRTSADAAKPVVTERSVQATESAPAAEGSGRQSGRLCPAPRPPHCDTATLARGPTTAGAFSQEPVPAGGCAGLRGPTAADRMQGAIGKPAYGRASGCWRRRLFPCPRHAPPGTGPTRKGKPMSTGSGDRPAFDDRKRDLAKRIADAYRQGKPFWKDQIAAFKPEAAARAKRIRAAREREAEEENRDRRVYQSGDCPQATADLDH